MLCILENGALQRVTYLCIHVSVDGYLWSGFNSAEHDLAEQCRAVLAFSNLTCQMLLLGVVSVATLESLSPYSLTKFSGSLCGYKI